MRFSVSKQPIDTIATRRAVVDNSYGALVVFEGWIRDHNEGREVARLEYEVYRPLAEKVGRRILLEAAETCAMGNAICIHREGLLELGEIAVIVCVSAPHRAAAFTACRYIIDAVKSRLPIWKKEHYTDGVSEWVNCQSCASAAHVHGEKTDE